MKLKPGSGTFYATQPGNGSGLFYGSHGNAVYIQSNNSNHIKQTERSTNTKLAQSSNALCLASVKLSASLQKDRLHYAQKFTFVGSALTCSSNSSKNRTVVTGKTMGSVLVLLVVVVASVWN